MPSETSHCIGRWKSMGLSVQLMSQRCCEYIRLSYLETALPYIDSFLLDIFVSVKELQEIKRAYPPVAVKYLWET